MPMIPEESLRAATNSPSHRNNNNCQLILSPNSRTQMAVGGSNRVLIDCQGNYIKMKVHQAVITEILCMWCYGACPPPAPAASMNPERSGNGANSTKPSTTTATTNSNSQQQTQMNGLNMNIDDVAQFWQAKFPKKEKVHPEVWDPLIHPNEVKCFKPRIQQA